MKIKNILLMTAVATAILTGCGSKESKVETTEFVDDVKVALADGGHIDLSKLQKGRNTLRLSNPSNWMPDIDYIELKATDKATAIHPVKLKNNLSDTAYDLNGKVMTQSNVTGIFIKNGRKYTKK